MSGAKEEETPLLRSNVYPPKALSASSLPALSLLLQSFLEEKCRETLQGYIWQREAPRVTVDASEKDVSRLVVTMRHGGSLEDEWLAVHLLLLATSDDRFSESGLLRTLEGKTSASAAPGGGLVVDIKDEDGQFLLIEAADHLPSWVQPDNADGRVWLYEGKLHLISPKVHKGDVSNAISSTIETSDARSISSSTAIDLIRSKAHSTLAPPAFMTTITTQRMPSYPDLSWALYNQHCTLAYLPRRAAIALNKQPQMIADAAEAFEGREGPNDARRLREMKIFGPAITSIEAMGKEGRDTAITHEALLVKVHLPRRLYASFITPRYLPSKVFGEEWRQEVSTYWEILEMATRGEETGREEERNRGRRRDLGCKIACGLELAYWTAKERSRGKHQDLFSSSNDDELRKTAQYASFIDALQRIDFFGSNIRDSKEWKEREKKALDLWKKSQSLPADDEHTSDTLQHLLDISTADDASSSSLSSILPPHFEASTSAQALALEEDPDAFMYDLPDQLKEAAERQSRDDLRDAEDGETEEERVAMSQVNAFADKLQSFVEGEGDIDGAVFDDEEMDSGDENDDDESMPASKKVDELTKEEREEAMKDLIPSLSLDEWGAKEGKEKSRASTEGEKQGEEGRKSTAAATGFSRRVQYDGASDSEESVDDEVLRAGDTEEDRRNRAKWLGIEREVEEDEDYRRRAQEDDGHEIEADDGDGEGEDVAFGQDEMMSFIEFTRKELGLSEEQYEDILRKRRERGAYVPEVKSSNKSKGKGKKVSFGASAEGEQITELSTEMESEEGQDAGAAPSHKTGQQIQAEKKKEREKALKNQRTTGEEKEAARKRAQRFVEDAEAQAEQRKQKQILSSTESSASKSASQKEDPFAKLMDAMDSELANHQKRKAGGDTTSKFAPVSVDHEEEDENDADDMDLDEMSAEDAELLEKMLHSGPPASLRALLEKQNNPTNPSSKLSSVEQEVMQSMLASYQAQLGGAGPAGALAGRLGIGPLLMNDDDS